MRFVLSGVFMFLASTANANTCGPFTNVSAGETYFSISQRCGIPVEQMFTANPGVDHNDLYVGQTLALDLPNSSGGAAGSAQLYNTRFIGAYASSLTCEGANIRVDLTPASIRFRNFNTLDGIDEDWACPIASINTLGGDGVTLNLSDCWAKYVALSLDGDVMTFEYAARYEVRRCTR